MEDKRFNKIQIRIQYSWYHEFIRLLEGIPAYGIYTTKIFGAMTPPHYLIEFRFKDPAALEEFESMKNIILTRLWDNDIIVDEVSDREFMKIGKTIESEDKVDVKKLLKNNLEKS